MGRQIVVVLSLLHVVKLFDNTTFALVQSQVYSTGSVFNLIGIFVPTEVKGSSYIFAYNIQIQSISCISQEERAVSQGRYEMAEEVSDI